jgi:ribosomal protein L7Ae-like RNA K-turn-binding protein
MAEVKEIMGFLGLSRRAGKLSCGHDAVIESIVKDKAELVILASFLYAQI